MASSSEKSRKGWTNLVGWYYLWTNMDKEKIYTFFWKYFKVSRACTGPQVAVTTAFLINYPNSICHVVLVSAVSGPAGAIYGSSACFFTLSALFIASVTE